MKIETDPIGCTRRTLLLTGGALAAPTVLRAGTGAAPEPVVIDTAAGRVRGYRSGGADVFKGIPYGDTVSGRRRFRPARPAQPWSGVLDARRLGTPSLQDPSTVYGKDEPAPGEDCLVLNIWAPAGGGRGKPVMFYSHGGGFTTGSAGGVTQDGSHLAARHDVVVVASNHRLGLLGYLYLGELAGAEAAGSGNQGLADILLALQWVGRNIAAFGGDPHNVTIFGESGGGAKTSCLYAMPAASHLFAKAIIQSGPAVRIGTPDTAARTTRMLLDELGLTPVGWRRLFETPAADLLAAQKRLEARAVRKHEGWNGIADFGPGGYGPLVDGALMPSHPFDPAAPLGARDKPLMVGSLDREAAFFAWQAKDREAFELDDAGLQRRMADRFGPAASRVIAAYRSDRPTATPSDIYLAAQSAQSMGLGSIAIAERKARQGGAPVFYYNLAYRSDMRLPGTDHELGAMHAIDIPLVFDNAESPTTLAGGRADRIAAAANTSRFWTSFARTGRPTATGQPSWPAYDLERREAMVIDSRCQVVSDRWGAERRMWQTIRD